MSNNAWERIEKLGRLTADPSFDEINADLSEVEDKLRDIKDRLRGMKKNVPPASVEEIILQETIEIIEEAKEMLF